MSATMTWVKCNRYMYGGSAIGTVAAAIAAISAAITAVSTKWVVSSNSGGMLEIKAAGSPAGDLATVRFLLFGGSTPNAAALQSGQTAVSTSLYSALCVDANTTGPVQSYTLGNPYNGKNRVIVGVMACNSFSATTNAFVDILETDEALHINVCANGLNTCWSVTMGLIVDDPSGIARWAVCSSGTAIPSAGMSTSTTVWHVPAYTNTLTANYGFMEVGNGTSTVRYFSRFSSPVRYYNASNQSLLADGSNAYLLPIYLTRTITATVNQRTYAGVMRQMKWGPYAIGGSTLIVGGQNKAYASGAQAECCHPIWMSVDP